MSTEVSRSDHQHQPLLGLLLLDASSYAAGDLDGDQAFVGLTRPGLMIRHAEGCTVEGLIHDDDNPAVRDALIAAALVLQESGAEIITGDCGFMIRYQAAVADALDIPVLLSSLLLAPLLTSVMGVDRKLLVVTASAKALTPKLFELSGVADLDRIIIADMSGQPAFDAAIMECTAEIDEAAIEAETLSVVNAKMAMSRDVGAVLLECTALPQYAAAIRASVGVPVYDVIRLADLVISAARPPLGQRIY